MCVYQIKSVGLWIFLVVCNHINLPCVLQSIKTHFTGCLSPPLSPLYKKLTALPHVLPSSIVTLISAVVFISSCTSPHLTHSSPTADLSYNGFIFSSVTCYTHYRTCTFMYISLQIYLYIQLNITLTIISVCICNNLHGLLINNLPIV